MRAAAVSHADAVDLADATRSFKRQVGLATEYN
jgi:hypothetical protein